MTVHFLNILNLTGLRSVFTTLAHSLWLGAIMAMLAGVIIILTKRSGSLLRYKLLTGLLMLFAVSIVYIFFNALTSIMDTLTAGNVIAVPGQPEIQQTENMQQQKAVFSTLLSFIEKYSDAIVSIWFIVICFKCIRLISGLRALHRLKKTNILEADACWIERMNKLAVQIGIVKQVALLQSSLAKIPMVIGHLKPIILFPVGILNGLPANEVEAILLHELAHIRRNDFLINFLQQFAEIIFFFNPGVLWVSALIKNERENCCDDIAIAVTRDKKIFIHALVAFQEYNAGLTYATTFPGSKNHLLNRVKRIITNNNKTLNNMEKLILASGIIITSLAALSFSPGGNKVQREAVKPGRTIVTATNADNVTIKETNAGDTHAASKYNYGKKALPQKEITDDTSKIHYSGVIDGKKVELTEENGQVKELYVDGKKIPEDQYDKYTAIIEKVHREMKENTAKLKLETELLKVEKAEMEQQQTAAMEEAKAMKEQRELMEKDFSRQEEQMKQQQVEMQKEMKLNSKRNEEMMKAEALKDAADYKQQRQLEMQNENNLNREKNEKMMKVQSQKMQADLIRQKERLQLKQAEFQKQAEKMKLQQQKFNEMMKDSVRAKRIRRVRPVVNSRPQVSVKAEAVVASAFSVRPEVSVKSVTSVGSAAVKVSPVTSVSAISSVNAVPVATVYATSNSISDEIIRDLEKANIINTRSNLSFRLTNDELIVNGVKQTDAIHQNILKRYVRKQGDNISLTYSNQQ